MDDEFGSISFSSLKETTGEVFPLFARVVRNPAFDGERLALFRTLALQAIDRRSDSAETMASIAFGQLLYGEKSPQGRVTTPESINKISRKDLFAVLSAGSSAGRLVIATYGRFNAAGG